MFLVNTRAQANTRPQSTASSTAENDPVSTTTERCPPTDCTTRPRPRTINRLSDDEARELLTSVSRKRPLNAVIEHKEASNVRQRLCAAPSRVYHYPEIRTFYSRPDVQRDEGTMVRTARHMDQIGDLKNSLLQMHTDWEWEEIKNQSKADYYDRRYNVIFESPVCLYCDNRYFGWDRNAKLHDGVVCEHCFYYGNASHLDQYLHQVLLQEHTRRLERK